MIGVGIKKKNVVYVPESIIADHYSGMIYGNHFEESGIFNVFSADMVSALCPGKIGYIHNDESPAAEETDGIAGLWKNNILSFTYHNEKYDIQTYNLYQNIFSRNTGILESSIMSGKCAVILGCGSVGSLVALELTRAGVGKFVLLDNDILEYHNLCRHQCSISDVGDFKVNALAKRILEINPAAEIEKKITTVEQASRQVFDQYCKQGNTIIIGCADNRAADVYANGIAAMYQIPFLSIGFWERAFAGELFYYLPGRGMPCYKCALGDGSNLSQRTNANRRIYTNEENLANVNFEPGISADINFVTTIGVKLALDILNLGNDQFTPRLIGHLQQYTLVCNTNNPKIGGEMAEIFSYPLQITTSLKVGFCSECPPCRYE